MSSNNGAYTESFAQYLQSVVKLDALEKMTADLDKELADSQNIMKEIKTLFDGIPNAQQQQHIERPRFHEVSQFVEAGAPKILLPDMVVTNDTVDIDKIVASMKSYAEDLRKNLYGKEQKTNFEKMHINNLDLAPYATSLDQLSKSLANVKITTDVSTKSVELERKLNQLCEDVTLFTQMVNTNGKLGESVQNWIKPTGTSTVTYDNIINKLLSDINEVTYLLKNNN